MTGEITLRGRVLPIGAYEKKRCGASRWHQENIDSKGNEKDLEEIPEAIRGELEVVFVSHADKVLENALMHSGQLWKGLVSKEMDEAPNPPLQPTQPTPRA